MAGRLRILLHMLIMCLYRSICMTSFLMARHFSLCRCLLHEAVTHQHIGRSDALQRQQGQQHIYQ